jgi:hypothetical protein
MERTGSDIGRKAARIAASERDAIEFQTRKNMSVALRRYTVDIDTTGALLSYFLLAFRATPAHHGWDHAD